MERSAAALAFAAVLSLASGDIRAGTEAGSCLEEFSLRNFQPQSPAYDQEVSSALYRKRAAVLMLLASW